MTDMTSVARTFSTRIGHLFTHDSHQEFKQTFLRSGIKMLYADYASLMIAGVAGILGLSIVGGIVSGMFVPFVAAGEIACVVFLLMFLLYPIEEAEFKKKRIAIELPPALAYLSAMIGAGATPVKALEMISGVTEYEELSRVTKRIIQRIEDGGMALQDSLEIEADRSPAPRLTDVLKSLRSEILTGGDLTRFFEEKADDAMSEYVRIQEGFENYVETLSTVYTTVFLLAPLLFLIMIIVMGFLGGGQFMEMQVTDLLAIGTFLVIPVMNIGFIVLVKAIQPEGM
ncbi:MAG: type II secretion system F family protein [Candidatus Diapherotrites archaeon]|nr:type II secretion system F family protein [Candidatus Diapherotrites archaeon]